MREAGTADAAAEDDPEDTAGTAARTLGPHATAGDQIRLVLPAEPDYGRLARIAASSLALRLGLTFADIEDLRIAVDETVILLLRPEGSRGDITLEFTIEPNALVIDASTTAGDDQHWLDAGARRRFDEIVQDTVDVHEVDEELHHVHIVKKY